MAGAKEAISSNFLDFAKSAGTGSAEVGSDEGWNAAVKVDLC